MAILNPLLGPKTLTHGPQEFHNFNRGIQRHHHHAFIFVKILFFFAYLAPGQLSQQVIKHDIYYCVNTGEGKNDCSRKCYH